MKKSIFMILLVLALFAAGCALAETTVRHYIPEAEVTFEIPIDLMCVTRDADKTNTFFQIPGFDYETTHQYLINNSCYLYGMTTDYMGEFAVLITDFPDGDLDAMSDSEFTDTMNELKTGFQSQGMKDVKCQKYQGSGKKAILMHYTLASAQMNQYVEFYWMTHRSKLLMIRFISFYNPISAKQEKMIRDIVGTAEWGKKNYSSEPKGKTEQGIYTDFETGLTFFVPSGWSEVKFVAAEEGKKVKYRIGSDNVWVLYEGEDLWSVVTDSYGSLVESAGITRKEIGNDLLSKELIANMLGCRQSDVSMKTVGGQEYYCMNSTESVSSGVLSLEAQNIVYICVRDAYMYWFQLSGMDIGKYENEFIRFMGTIVYP